MPFASDYFTFPKTDNVLGKSLGGGAGRWVPAVSLSPREGKGATTMGPCLAPAEFYPLALGRESSSVSLQRVHSRSGGSGISVRPSGRHCCSLGPGILFLLYPVPDD